jgi:hypothetical protein
MTPSYSPVRAVRRVLVAASVASVALTAIVAGTAAAGEVTCDTDYECAAVELLQANVSGVTLYEDLSFPGMSDFYAGKRDLLAERFYADTGADWPSDRHLLEDWLDEQIGAE